MKDQQYVPIALSDEQRQHHVDPTTNRLGKPMIGYDGHAPFMVMVGRTGDGERDEFVASWLAGNTRDAWFPSVTCVPCQRAGCREFPGILGTAGQK